MTVLRISHFNGAFVPLGCNRRVLGNAAQSDQSQDQLISQALQTSLTQIPEKKRLLGNLWWNNGGRGGLENLSQRQTIDLALSKVQWGFQSSSPDLVHHPSCEDRHGPSPQLGGPAGRLPADQLQRIPGRLQRGLHGGRPAHHLLLLLPRLVPPAAGRCAPPHLGGGPRGLDQPGPEVV